MSLLLLNLAIATLTTLHPVEEKVMLRIEATKDQRFEYQGIVDISGEKLGSLHGTFHRAERVIAASPEAVVQSAFFVGVSSSGNGILVTVKGDFDKLAGKSFQTSTLPNGRPTNGKKVNKEGAGTIIDLVFPDSEISVSDTWKSRLYQDDELADVEIVYKLISVSPTEAKIEATTTNSPKFKTSSPFVFIVDRKSGRPKFIKGVVLASPGGTTIEIRFEMKMIVPHQIMSFLAEAR